MQKTPKEKTAIDDSYREKCKKCNKEAKYKIQSPFEVFYCCGIHIKKFRKNMWAVINYI